MSRRAFLKIAALGAGTALLPVTTVEKACLAQAVPESLDGLLEPIRDEFGQGYALGWGVVQRGWAGGTALTHSGSNTLWYAVVWLTPARNAAFLAATNCGSEAGFRACDAAVGAMITKYLS